MNEIGPGDNLRGDTAALKPEKKKIPSLYNNM